MDELPSEQCFVVGDPSALTDTFYEALAKLLLELNRTDGPPAPAKEDNA